MICFRYHTCYDMPYTFTRFYKHHPENTAFCKPCGLFCGHQNQGSWSECHHWGLWFYVPWQRGVKRVANIFCYMGY